VSIEVLSVQSIPAVPTQFWSSFHRAAGVYQSRPWLEFVEWSAGPAVKYVQVTDGEEALGLLPVYPEPGAAGSGYSLAELAGASAAPGTAWLCGNRRAYRNEILLASLSAASGTGQKALAMLTAAVQEAGPHANRPWLAFPYLSRDYAEVLCDTLPHSVPLLSKLDANIDIDGRSFDEYVRDLGSKQAGEVRREMQRFERAGYTVDIERLADCWYEAGPLVANVQRRYGHDDTPESCRNGLRRQAELLGGLDVVFTARRGGRLVAVTVCYEWNGTLASRVVGFDYPSLAGAMEYFYLNFYRPLEYACARGLTRILLGTGSEQAKQRRGACLTGLWTVIAAAGPALVPGNWRARNAQVREQFAAVAGHRKAELSDGWFGGGNHG
jgi:uncharacterized protein